MPQDAGILTELLGVFLGLFTAGLARTIPDALDLLRWLAVIEIAMLAIRWGATRQIEAFALAMLIAGVSVVQWMILQWPSLLKWAMNTFVGVGLKAGGDALSVTDFTDPANIANYGLSVTAVIFARLKDYSGISAVLNIPEVFLSGLSAWCVVITYFALACWAFLVIVGFYASGTLAIVLLPFAIFRWGTWLAEKALGFVAAAAIQAMSLAFILSLALPALIRYQPGMNPTLRECFMMLLVAMVLSFMAAGGAAFGFALIHGAPQLSLGQATQYVSNAMSSVIAATHAASSTRAATQPSVGRQG